MWQIFTIFCILGHLVIADNPANFKICKRSDSNLNSCLQEAIQDAYIKLKNGIPALGITPLEPLDLPSATIGEGKGAVNVVQKYTDLKLSKLSDTKISDVQATVTGDKFTADWKHHVPALILDGKYDFNGRLLLVPIVGQGHCTLTLKDLTTDVHITGKTEQKKGKKYLKIDTFDIKLRPGRAVYDFKNLFNGDETLGRTTNQLMNDNWKEVFDDVKAGYEEVFGLLFKSYANQVLSKLPYDEYFPE